MCPSDCKKKKAYTKKLFVEPIAKCITQQSFGIADAPLTGRSMELSPKTYCGKP